MVGEQKFVHCSQGLGHMTKVVAMHIYGKNPSKIFSGTERRMTLKLGMQHWWLGPYQVCSNDDPCLILTFLTARSNSIT